jgi:DNA adenine methylase Dam
MNYIGNKYRILKQIEPLFPKNINKMVDLFCGGCDVILNVDAKEKYANDINYHVIDIFKEMKNKGTDYVLNYINKRIDEYQLSKTNEEGYLKLRKEYNKTYNALDLYVLMCYGFNHQFRFNANHEYNNAFGRNRSSFNERMKNNLVQMIPRLENINFSIFPFQDFSFQKLGENDFLYADPPYLISCGSYNDGKRGFIRWDEKQEKDLYGILDYLNKKNVKFALSNVIEHKGKTNDVLMNWIKENDYNIHNINFNYNNSSYHAKNTDKVTKEILITNYK